MSILSQKQLSNTPFNRLAMFAAVLAIVIGATYFVQLQFIGGKPASNTPAKLNGKDSSVIEPTINQTVINDDDGAWLATFTKNARTVLMRGPTRTFSEPSGTIVTVTTDKWVRLYPKVYDGNVDRAWLDKMVEENKKQSSPDIIATAMQYIAGAKTEKNDKGQVIAGDAGYGPTLPNGDRESGADFNDYIGIPYDYRGTVDQPEARFAGYLDNTGFLRMVWGYRAGLPISEAGDKTAIPRSAAQMLVNASGVLITSSPKQQITDFSRLQVGDIVLNGDDGRISEAGIYLGPDSESNHRFISSRQAPNGPTFGDIGGKPILNGNGSFARSFHGIHRF